VQAAAALHVEKAVAFPSKVDFLYLRNDRLNVLTDARRRFAALGFILSVTLNGVRVGFSDFCGKAHDVLLV
jgi:hypothetical protein